MLNNSHIKILFVCQNNTSLSPMAAQIFINMLRKLKILDRFTIDSAATSITEEGQSMNILAKEKLERRKYAQMLSYSRKLRRLRNSSRRKERILKRPCIANFLERNGKTKSLQAFGFYRRTLEHENTAYKI